MHAAVVGITLARVLSSLALLIVVDDTAAAFVLSFEEEEDGDFDAVSRTIGQALDVDGVTNLYDAAGVQSGSMIEVEIVDCLDYDLIARVI